MTRTKQIIALGVAWLLLPAIAATGAAQEPKRQEPPPGAKGILSLFDSKQMADPKSAAAAAAFLEAAYEGARPPESVRMLIAILRGSQMGPGEGWFGPAESRYSWKWLAGRCGVDPSRGGIARKSFNGPDAWFLRLDRNRDGAITPDDLDWSDRNPYVQMSAIVNRLYRRLNASGDGRLTREELMQFFDQATRGKEHLSADDFRAAMLAGFGAGGFLPGDAPTPALLVRGVFSGEVGSMNEGPHVDQPAPIFTLRTVDGKESVSLAKLIGPKPLVLVLGNFSCGPFRSMYPDVEAVYERWKDEANFLMVYVREAHPTDGWHMSSNARVGVAVKQPTTLGEREQVAGQFCQRLKPAIPVVVDEINDPVGHAYSGMPARLYVVDTRGKVAYKSGRGPFGFRVGEMEQALIMTLLDAPLERKTAKDK
jgi:Iodothyronine deiodinase/EF hand